MNFSENEICHFLKTYYQLRITVKALTREYDCNYLVEDKEGKKYIFEIANDEHGYEFFDAQVKIVNHLSATGIANNFCRRIKNIVGKELMVFELDGKRYCLHLLAFLDGEF